MSIRTDRLSGESIEIARLKQELHRQANGRLKGALENGYWIEAVCIEESLMADRIESYFRKHHESRRINNLGRWCYELLNSTYLSARDVALFKEVLDWSKLRNKMVHEIVKVSESHRADWDKRLIECMEAAIQGKWLATEVNKWSKRVVK